MTTIREERQQTLIILARLIDEAIPSRVVADNLIQLDKLGKTLRQRYENECSYTWANEPRYLKTTAKKEAKAKQLALELGLAMQLQTDPRGWSLVFSFNRDKDDLPVLEYRL